MISLIIYLLGGLFFSFMSEYTVSDEMIELNETSRGLVRLVSVILWPAYVLVFIVQLIKGLFK
tara:strand:+ start:514 stop:702 length:189 start_codon:yes stop_codon:yes gene_type:complete